MLKTRLGFGSSQKKTVTDEEAAILESQGINVHEENDGSFTVSGSRTYYNEDNEAEQSQIQILLIDWVD